MAQAYPHWKPSPGPRVPTRRGPERRKLSPYRPVRPAPKGPLRPAKVPFIPYRPLAPVPGRVGAKAAAYLAGRFATRLIPYVGWGLLAYDVYRVASELWYKPANAGSIDFAGWTHQCAIGATGVPRGYAWKQVAGADPVSCNLNTPGDVYTRAMPAIKPTTGTIFFGDTTVLPAPGQGPANGRFRIKDSWTKNAPSSPTPYQIPYVLPDLPLLPEPAPFQWPRPGRGGDFKQPQQRPRNKPKEKKIRRPGHREKVQPYERGAIQFEPGTGRAPVSKPHLQLKPTKRYKEKKGVFNASTKMVKKIVDGTFGTYTEFDDFVNAMWKSLPKELQTRKPRYITDKLKDLWKHWDQADLGDAALNYAMNEIQDNVIGKANKYASKITKNDKWVSPFGPGAGGRKRGAQLPKIDMKEGADWWNEYLPADLRT